jgi:tripeptide aminopeptidase
MNSSINSERLLGRFLEYVRIDTTAVEGAERYPSSDGQWVLGRLLVRQLKEAGAADVRQDEHGLVWATLPATLPATGERPHQAARAIAWNAHLDTSPETTGANVRPQVIRDYRGGDLALPGHAERVLRVDENPALAALVGKTIITTDGTTLLGADDKAGVAVIMEAAEFLLEHPEIPHRTIRLLFTCDEEIGLGVSKVNVGDLDAVACYTLDGQGVDEIDVETFSADLATVTVLGVNIHPSIANGRMVNALRAAGALLAKLPRETLSPESTVDREGFLHPYTIDGGVAEVTIKVLLRDFETSALTHKADLLRSLSAETQSQFPGTRIDVAVSPQYRNMADGLLREPRAVRYAQEAHRRLGREAKLTIVRGGTDGSQFTAQGLPTPNLSTGEHNLHSPLEWTCLEEMASATELLVELARVWGEDNDSDSAS